MGRVAWVGLTLSTILFLSIKAPEIHSSFIRESVGKSVVSIYGKNHLGITVGGTGFHVKGKSGKIYILTNGHICTGADEQDKVYVSDRSSLVSYPRSVVYRYPTHDLCLVEGLPNHNNTVGIADNFSIGEGVGLIGHPRLRPLTLSRGEIIGQTKISLVYAFNIPKLWCIGKFFDEKEALDFSPELALFMMFNGASNVCLADKLNSTMITAISYGGNSGSPVVNFWGNIVGVLYAGGRDVTDAYIVPLNEIQSLLERF